MLVAEKSRVRVLSERRSTDCIRSAKRRLGDARGVGGGELGCEDAGMRCCGDAVPGTARRCNMPGPLVLRRAGSFRGPGHTKRRVAGRLASERDALGKPEYYGYDAVANLLWRTDGDRQSTYYVFDPLARQVRIGFPEGYSAYFTYDALGSLIAAHDPYESDYFAYDPLGRLVQRTIPGVATVYFAYDLAGRRTSLKDTTGTAVYYAYDARGLMSRADARVGPTLYTYDARGALLTRLYPNGTCAYHTCEAAGRLSRLENRKKDATVISRFEFARDPNGNITRSLRKKQGA